MTWVFERLFYGLSRLSPERLFARSRVEIQNRYYEIEDRQKASRIRGRKIEVYLMGWFSLEVLTAFLGIGIGMEHSWYLAFCALMVLRVVDILQITVNISVFDRMRLLWRDHYHESVPRSLILSILNYFELILCFGVVYLVLGAHGMIEGAAKNLDAFYYSAVTQLTIGYGDIRPHGFAKIVSVVQGFTGFLFTILILSRMVNLLPEIQSEDPQS